MDSVSKKAEIVEAFIQKVESSSLRNVHVAKLIMQLGINRNTFYYHFDSKYDVALLVFRYDLAGELKKAFSEDELVCAPVGTRKSTEILPFYAHREGGARTLDQGEFFKALVRCILSRPVFYGSLFDSTQTEFRACIETLYRPAIQDDLRFMLGGRYLPDSVFDFFADYYTRYIFQIAEYYAKHTRAASDMLDERVNPFWNMAHESLLQELQTHPVQRPRNSR